MIMFVLLRAVADVAGGDSANMTSVFFKMSPNYGLLTEFTVWTNPRIRTLAHIEPGVIRTITSMLTW